MRALTALALALLHPPPLADGQAPVTWGSLSSSCSVVAITDANGPADEELGCWIDGCADPWGGGGCPNPVVRALVTPAEEAAAQAGDIRQVKAGCAGCSASDPSAMSKDGCHGHCAAGGFKYAGMEGGYICYCGNGLVTSHNPNLKPTKQSECLTKSPGDAQSCITSGDCGTPCYGESGVMCGGAPYRMEVVRLECGDGGWFFVTIFLVCVAGYAGGGAAVGSRVAGAPSPALQHHPHRGQWTDIHSLVLDGWAFSRACLQSGQVPPPRSGSALDRSALLPDPPSSDGKGRSVSKSKPSGGKKPKRSSSKGSGRLEAPDSTGAAAGDAAVLIIPDGVQEGRGIIGEQRDFGGLHSSQAKVKVVALGGT